MNYILRILDKTELSKTIKFLYFLFLPITYIIEVFTYWYFWRKIILPELLTKDEIVEWLKKEEFEYNYFFLYKKDMVEPDSQLSYSTPEQLAIIAKKEYTKSVTQIIANHVNIDIENYLNIFAKSDIVPGKINIKVYTVYIRYYRYFIILSYLKYFLLYLLSATFLYFAISWCLTHLTILNF